MHSWLIFVEGFKNWRVNWRKLTVIYLSVYLPLTLLDIFWVSNNTKIVLVQLASNLVHWLLDGFVMASLILSVQEQFNATASKARETMRAVIPYLWRYLLTILLYGLIFMSITILVVMSMSFIFATFVKAPQINLAVVLAAALAIVACILALVYCAIRFSLAGVISIMEKAGPITSLKTSHSLIKKNIAPVVGVFIFIFLISALLFFPGLLLNLLIAPNTGVNGVSMLLIIYQVLVGAVTVPIWVSVMGVLYKKLKEKIN